MKLSTKSRYGVRAVFDIAYHNQGRPTQARDIARRQEVPLRYLEQIFQELRRANLVEAKRGPRGGYFLARAPETITLGDVVRAVQGPIELIAPEDDSHAGGERARESRSKLVPASIWKELAQKIRACFDGVTIKDLCQRGEALGIHRGDGQPHMYFI
ncbi:MAG TPA: Rrf2 family transcriptional regulator [Polyangia bacterium]|nr:Rrf2 family transcriptional regulator [Polyangia bacterium]